jgi:hypothetical protein
MTQSMTACPKLMIEINTLFCKQLCNKHNKIVGCIYKTPQPEEPMFVIDVVDRGE